MLLGGQHCAEERGWGCVHLASDTEVLLSILSVQCLSYAQWCRRPGTMWIRTCTSTARKKKQERREFRRFAASSSELTCHAKSLTSSRKFSIRMLVRSVQAYSFQCFADGVSARASYKSACRWSQIMSRQSATGIIRIVSLGTHNREFSLRVKTTQCEAFLGC